MVVFPHCKINLGLHVLRRRGDGYHDLETLFYPVPLKDVLEIVPAVASDGKGEGRLFVKGSPIPGDRETNLCVRAWRLLKKDLPGIPPVDTWLYKNIPMGAGLGGGSSDGAFMLGALDRKFRLELGRERLAAYALQLGSDCPFFLYDQPCFATGRGELLEPFAVDLSNYFIVLVYPGVHIPTAWAFAEVAPSMPPIPLRQALAGPVSDWRSTLVNVFEAPVCKRYPDLQKVKDQLYHNGAVYASMTGSGSAFFGLFPRGARQVDGTGGRAAADAGAGDLGATDGRAGPSLPDAGQFPGYFFRIL
jgi:4-diphosphocytidyl-2-C-methyl-D-erythritol kinase